MISLPNPYVQTLTEMGYDQDDCNTPSKEDVTYPRTIHGRTFHTKEEYDEALSDYLNGL